ncbi:MAG: CDP-diacylglycerol--glycerol-3-phosphate 3-phosphatidyltransferase [Candidatus Dormibacteria bacterium]
MTAASWLTLSRIAVIPVLMLLLLSGFPGHFQWAAAVFLVFSLTDSLDGTLARRTGTVTEFGKLLDPIADKLFILSVLFVLVQEGMLAAWIAVVILAREALITGMRIVAASQGIIISATPFGKTKTVTQIAAVELLILARPFPGLWVPAAVAVALTVGFTLYSGGDYLWRYRQVVLR